MTFRAPPPVSDDTDILGQNKELADVLNLIGEYHTLEKETYRAKAFKAAALKISQHPNIIISGTQARRELTGIGASIEGVIDEYFATGTSQRLKELEQKFSDRKATIDCVRSFYGIGPVTANKLYNQGLRTLEDLWSRGNLTQAQQIGIMWRDHINLRIPREEMNIINDKIGSILNPYGIKWTIAGSYRREESSSGDIDILVESRPDLNMLGLSTLLQPIIPATLAEGQTKVMAILRLSDQYNGHRVDIRLVEPIAYPAALMYFTGSQRFNILMRQRAIEFGLTLNEYGLYNQQGQPLLIQSEEDIFRTLRV